MREPIKNNQKREKRRKRRTITKAALNKGNGNVCERNKMGSN